ncbi:phenylalanine--tRNA ligase subunit beta [bacterium]|nr:phenylalanine--tRNA ligase subunit beta [bacterium]
MLIGYNWLKDYVKVPFSPQELADRLTMIGLEVSSIEVFQKGLELCKVGRIEVISPHPNADRLSLCQVDVGEKKLSIVCGASNIKSGDKVPVALLGAKPPRGTEIKKASVRGITSEGMLCSEWELGIGDDHSGIMILPEDAQIGMDIAEYLKVSDTIFEIDLTPNRADCLSHLGIAREIAAMTDQIASLPEIRFTEEGGPIEKMIEIQITDPSLCFRYAARIVTGINIAPSPLWLSARLESVGIRSVNNVVDITNLVMMETGQPLHAFDYDLIQGKKILIRPAEMGERFKTLDGIERSLDPTMLMIADANHPIAVAGVMGGMDSEVTEKTINILIESALFNPKSVRKTSLNLGLSTEASQRFERGIDPDGVLASADRATQLILHIAGGKPAKGSIDLYPNPIKKEPVRLRAKRVNGCLGLNISSKQVYNILKGLSFKPLSPAGEDMVFIPPSFRQDIFGEVDLIEEVARFYGYDNIPTTIPSSKIPMGDKISKGQNLEYVMREILVGTGFYEVINFSFTKKCLFDIINLGVKEGHCNLVEIKNPLTEDHDTLRPSVIPCLIQSLVFNLSHQNRDLKLFEFGTCFLTSQCSETGCVEGKSLGIAMSGLMQGKHWRQPDIDMDFYDIKGQIEFILDSIGVKGYLFEMVNNHGLAEGQSLKVMHKGRQFGILGRLSQRTAVYFDIKRPVFVAELDFDYICGISEYGRHRFKAIPKFPPVLRDMAIVVEKDVPFQRIIDLIREEGGKLLEDANLFDLYSGKQIPDGKKSLAFSLTYRSSEKTLTDKMADKVYQRIFKRLKSELNAEMRVK